MSQQTESFRKAFIELEKLCNDIYGGHHGVTQYIDEMSATCHRGVHTVPGWSADYETLRNLRHIRNRMAHETEEGYGDLTGKTAWLIDFRQRILNGSDPLTILRRIENPPRPVKSATPGKNTPSSYRDPGSPSRQYKRAEAEYESTLGCLIAFAIVSGVFLAVLISILVGLIIA